MQEPRPLRLRAPLVSMVLCLILGLAIARCFPALPLLYTSLSGLILSLIALWITALNPGISGLNHMWDITWCLGMTMTAAVFGAYRAAPLPDAFWEEMPPREIEADFQVERVFERDSGSVSRSGIARVRWTNEPSGSLVGHTVAYSLYGPAAHLAIGSVFRARGVVTSINAALVSTDGFIRYLHLNDVRFLLGQGEILTVDLNHGAFFRWLSVQRDRFTMYLRAGSIGERHDLLGRAFAGMLLGRSALLPADARERLIQSGVMHLFAISGLHVMIIAITLEGFFALLRVRRSWRPAMGLTLLLVYVLIIGATPSAIRAFLMIAFFWSARAWERQHSSVAALSASALVVIFLEPRQLWSPGFQLSYAVVGSILLMGVPLASFFRTKILRRSVIIPAVPMKWAIGPNIRIRIAEAFAVSAAATVGSAPLVAGYFSVFGPGAIVLNMALIPIAALIVIDGVMVLSANLIGLAWVGLFLNHGAWVLLSVMFQCVDFALTIPGLFLQRSIVSPELGGILSLLWIAFLLLMRGRLSQRWLVIVQAIAAIFLLSLLFFVSEPIPSVEL